MKPCEMTLDDVSGGLSLSTQAGWNQNEDDWRFMLAKGIGHGFRDSEGNLIATALLFPVNARLFWISMVLVDISHRRKGLATRLLHSLMEVAKSLSCTVGLDATPAGRPLYSSLGFRNRYEIIRWRSTPLTNGTPEMSYATADTKGESGSITNHSRGVSEILQRTWHDAYSEVLLEHLSNRLPGGISIIKNNEDQILGLSAGRVGRTATQIGPVLARNEATAFELLDSYARHEHPLLLDSTLTNTRKNELLSERGFREERRFMRMTLGDASLLQPQEGLFAIAGPELG